jgi:hypothetical protein
MGDAVRIEQRLLDLFSGRRHKQGPQHPDRESPREMEQRAVERLYGGRPTVVVLDEHEGEDKST